MTSQIVQRPAALQHVQTSASLRQTTVLQQQLRLFIWMPAAREGAGKTAAAALWHAKVQQFQQVQQEQGWLCIRTDPLGGPLSCSAVSRPSPPAPLRRYVPISLLLPMVLLLGGAASSAADHAAAASGSVFETALHRAKIDVARE